MAGVTAEHVTLVLAAAATRMEVQSLGYRQPQPAFDPNISQLSKLGANTSV